jgi:hypothetical protein
MGEAALQICQLAGRRVDMNRPADVGGLWGRHSLLPPCCRLAATLAGHKCRKAICPPGVCPPQLRMHARVSRHHRRCCRRRYRRSPGCCTRSFACSRHLEHSRSRVEATAAMWGRAEGGGGGGGRYCLMDSPWQPLSAGRPALHHPLLARRNCRRTPSRCWRGAAPTRCCRSSWSGARPARPSSLWGRCRRPCGQGRAPPAALLPPRKATQQPQRPACGRAEPGRARAYGQPCIKPTPTRVSLWARSVLLLPRSSGMFAPGGEQRAVLCGPAGRLTMENPSLQCMPKAHTLQLQSGWVCQEPLICGRLFVACGSNSPVQAHATLCSAACSAHRAAVPQAAGGQRAPCACGSAGLHPAVGRLPPGGAAHPGAPQARRGGLWGGASTAPLLLSVPPSPLLVLETNLPPPPRPTVGTRPSCERLRTGGRTPSGCWRLSGPSTACSRTRRERGGGGAPGCSCCGWVLPVAGC